MVELQPLLKIDLAHIEKKIDELMKKDKQLQLIDGEIIAKSGIFFRFSPFLVTIWMELLKK